MSRLAAGTGRTAGGDEGPGVIIHGGPLKLLLDEGDHSVETRMT